MMDYAKYSVKLNSLMNNETSMIELNNALSTYPLYVGKKDYDLIPSREVLNEKILNHYKYREIGFETVGRFLDELKITMCEIMPRYNELFKTIEIMADLPNPFDNVDVVETYEEERTEKTETAGQTTGTQNATTSGTTTTASSTAESSENSATANDTHDNEHIRKFSDTPQNNVANINNYLSEHSVETDDGSNTHTESGSRTASTTSSGNDTNESTSTLSDNSTMSGSSDVTGTTKHTYTKTGNQGVNTYAHDMNEFRTSIIDVVEQIVNDERIDSLFMQVW